MVAIVKRLVSFLLIAMATSLSLEPSNATLTTFSAEYDGRAMFALGSVGEFGDIVTAQPNVLVTSQFNLLQLRVQGLAAAGTLTLVEFVRLLAQFKVETSKIVPKFWVTRSEQIMAARVETEEFIERAPTYWADFLFSTWISTATTMNDPPLTATVNTFITEIETDINNRVIATLINMRVRTFYAKAPAFAIAVHQTVTSMMSKMQAEFDREVEAYTVPPERTNTSTPTTTGPSPTTTASAPSLDTVNATTTAPAATVKSGATTFAMGAISSLVVAVTLAVATAL